MVKQCGPEKNGHSILSGTSLSQLNRFDLRESHAHKQIRESQIAPSRIPL